MNVFSTCWNSKRHVDGYAMCQEIRALGFEWVELSHGLKIGLIPGVLQAQEEGLVRVAGLHNFCPAPLEHRGDSPDVYEFTSHRSWERARALQLSRQSIDFAAQLGARYLVLHMGRVHLMRGNTASHQLEEAAHSGKLGSKDYAQLKNKIMTQRERLAPLYYERARLALQELVPYASKKKICLGVETRSHLEQIPNEGELLRLMEEFRPFPHIGYWHDFGHAQRKHNLLQLNHYQLLKSMQHKLIGAHINDVRWPARDHQCPALGSGHGGVEFEQVLAPFFSKDMPLSWEISRHVPAEKIRQARLKWESLTTKLWMK